MSSKKQLEALIEIACKSGKLIESFGDFDEESENGHAVGLFQHGGLFVVVERESGEDDHAESFTDEEEARETFAEIKAEIETVEADE